MKILLQRVSRAEVAAGAEVLGRIGRGVVLLVGFGRAEVDVARAADKVVNLRIFAGARGRPERSVAEVGGGVLAVPQFTLYGSTRKGRRPDFNRALQPALAESRFRAFVECLRQTPVAAVESGRFGADMRVEMVNDGPFTLMLEF